MNSANYNLYRRAKALAFLFAFLCVPLAAGCAITGTWQVIDVSPPGARFPLSTLSLDEDGRFTSTVEHDGADTTRTGTYQWNGRGLTLIASDGVVREFRGRKKSGGVLTLEWEPDSDPIMARLTKLK